MPDSKGVWLNQTAYPKARDEEDDEENDVSTLSGLDNHEICIKYQQVTPNLST